MYYQYLTPEKAIEKHPGSFIDFQYVKVTSENYHDPDSLPVATLPAIIVWEDEATAKIDKEYLKCIAIYWIEEPPFE